MSNVSQLLVGGDDVNAVVVDYGSHSFRYGHAGEEAPTFVLPSTVGWLEQVIAAVERMEETGNPAPDVVMSEPTENGTDSIHKNTTWKSRGVKSVPHKPAKMNEAHDGQGDGNISPRKDDRKERLCFVDPVLLAATREGLEIDSNIIVDGMIENWDAFEAILEYATLQHRPIDASQHPFLFSEPQWILKDKREALCELIFEKFNGSAFFTAKSPVLTCFAHGKTSGLVLDSGKTHSTAVAVHDGFCLLGTAVKSPLGGEFLTNKAKEELERMKVDLTPQYLIKSKEAVELEQPARFTKKQIKVTPSFHEYKLKELINDFKQVLAVSDSPLNDQSLDSFDAKEYEFPTGYRKSFTKERFHIPEYLFDPSLLRASGGPQPSSALGMSNLIHNCITITDPDIRQQLASNIIVTGGNSCLSGFVERVSADCARRSTSSMKFKCVVPGGSGPERSAERMFAPWIGGSILGSMGTFQNMWISRMEYAESGKAIVGKKCP